MKIIQVGNETKSEVQKNELNVKNEIKKGINIMVVGYLKTFGNKT
jgi:hypothetical protein